jgi:hypothetical protein
LPDGQLVLKSGKVVRPIAPLPVLTEDSSNHPGDFAREIKNGRAAAESLERIHRKLGDLPEQTEKMNAIACVLMYTGVGIADGDIAVALKTSVENIERLKSLDAYRQLAEMFDSTVFEDAKRTANHIVSRASAHAAQRIVSLISDEDRNIGLSAAKEVARMAGLGVDRVDTNKISSLNIKITRKGDSEDNITVEVNSA